MQRRAVGAPSENADSPSALHGCPAGQFWSLQKTARKRACARKRPRESVRARSTNLAEALDIISVQRFGRMKSAGVQFVRKRPGVTSLPWGTCVLSSPACR